MDEEESGTITKINKSKINKPKTMKIAIVIPTYREEAYNSFYKAWRDIFNKHAVTIYKVLDGPKLEIQNPPHDNVEGVIVSCEDIMGEHADLVIDKSGSLRNLGFAAAYKFGADVIISLDDDVVPVGDPIQDHIDALSRRVPISWMSPSIITKATDYPRGFPYGVRTEAPVVFSHGVWTGLPDYDAPTQLLTNDEMTFYKGPIPKGILYTMCGMNYAFRREATPYVYHANSVELKGAERFDDIWCGIETKKDLDARGLATVTGYATVNHTRLSNVFDSLIKEAVGIKNNEKYWRGEYDDFYKGFLAKRERWTNFIKGL